MLCAITYNIYFYFCFKKDVKENYGSKESGHNS